MAGSRTTRAGGLIAAISVRWGGEARVFPRWLALVMLALLSSCGSSGGPGSIVAPPKSLPATVVSRSAADHPDFLCDGVDDDVEINQALRIADTTAGRTVLLKTGTYQ